MKKMDRASTPQFFKLFNFLKFFEKTLGIVSLLLFSLFSVNCFSQSLHHPIAAGQVITSTGNVTAVSADEKRQPIKRGDSFFDGDTLTTSANSTAQVRFTDGTLLAMYANSTIKIDNYVYQQNPANDKSVTTLIKGGFRALTGLISKRNPDAYRFQTPVAVIGVRGTNYGAILNKGHLYAGVWKGRIYVQNDKGLIQLGEGDKYNFAQVLSKNDAPIGLINAPVPLAGQCSIG